MPGRLQSLLVAGGRRAFLPRLAAGDLFLLAPAAITVCVAAILLSLASRGAWLYSGGNEVAVQVFTLFRVDALALGGLLAFIARSPNGLKTLRPWAIVGCIVIFASMLPPIQLHKRVPASAKRSMLSCVPGSSSWP